MTLERADWFCAEPWAAAATAAAAAAVAASGVGAVWGSTKVNHDSRGMNAEADDGEAEVGDDGGEVAREDACTRGRVRD